MEICSVPSQFCCIVRMLLFLFHFILLAFTPPVFSTLHLSNRLDNASDQHSLLGFLSGITYDPSQSLHATWKPNVSFCHWTGIICSRRRQRVVSLDVSSMGLQGTISPLLSNLSFLRTLILYNNSFHGHIPYQLGSLFRLKMLNLSRNQLQDSIPTELCVLPMLQTLTLEANYLTGTIPACWGNMSALDVISLKNNNLHGSVPSELGMLSHVTYLRLSFNNLTGQIPSSLSNCTNLQTLSITSNQLTGHIPAELCSKSTRLMYLYFGINQLSGSIPASLFNSTNLQQIDLGFNQFTGVVPMELGKLTHLTYLSLGSNQLVSGSTTNLPLLTSLTNFSSLQTLELGANHFMGHLPLSIGHFSTKLDHINLEYNEFGGEIPPHIGNLTSLIYLGLNQNSFIGSIPSSFNMLQKLERLHLEYNNLQGNIPTEIGQLKSLGLLNLSRNNLSGRIPDSIAHLQQLRYLSLDRNQLLGNIPTNLGKCRNLLDLDLSYNMFSGNIPPEVAGLENLALSFHLSNNLLHGPIPLELSKMTMVQSIDISANLLTGYIPSALESCKEVEYLNLSCNALEGLIPISLGKLLNLRDLDFSSNNLSGGIPISLENLKMLSHLNFSFNMLSGEVPKGGVFKNLGANTFMGNLGLCGPWVGLSPCSAHKHKSVLHLKRVIILVVLVPTIVLCLFLGILWRKICKKHILREVEASLNVGYQRISYAELITATDGFCDTNLLGVGSFGKVYKGVLNDGTIIAIKLLNLENEGAHKSFERECKVLGRVRHRNLIRVITSYSNLQIKALIFPFMPNGSLEKWLYPDGGEHSRLSLIQRLNIAIDIAQGMSYLHHHCFMQVIHCDLKPNNVLLGEDMTAYLIDFGIATICFANDEDSTFSSTNALKGSTGYIPPEYGMGGHVTVKGDVYSYGIVLLEMLTHKKPAHNMFVEGMNLQKWVASGFQNGVGEVVDKSLLRTSSSSNEENKELNCLNQLISVGLHCTKESPGERPTMMDIVGILERIKDTFLEAIGNPKFSSNITHLLATTSTTHNNIGEGQSSSTI